jgi:hypothetical protein
MFHLGGKVPKVGMFRVRGGFQSYGEKDAAMTAASIVDIAWVRPPEEQKKMLAARGIKYDPNYKSGTQLNLERR